MSRTCLALVLALLLSPRATAQSPEPERELLRDRIEQLRANPETRISGVQIAAPVLLATLLCDVALGFIGKASPQLPVVFFGLSIKSMLGLLVLAGTLGMWPGFFEQRFSAAIGMSERLLHLAR